VVKRGLIHRERKSVFLLTSINQFHRNEILVVENEGREMVSFQINNNPFISKNYEKE